MDAAAERDAWSSFDPTLDKSVDDVCLPTQKFCIFQLAHAGTQIRSPDARPWIRCIGFATTLHTARDIARKAHDATKSETRIMPVGRNFLAARRNYIGAPIELLEEDQAKSNAMVDAWIEARKASFAAVEERIKVGEDFKYKPQAQPREEWKCAEIDRQELPTVPPVMMLTNQAFWAVAVIPDPVEPSLIPLFAAPTEADMKELLATASRSKDLVHFSIHVGPTCTWMPLSDIKATKIHKNPLRQTLESRLTWSDQCGKPASSE
jgi:hypothetical protein